MDTSNTGRLHARLSRGRIWLAAVAAIALAGCTHQPFNNALEHYSTIEVPAPKGSTVHVCSAYGCRTQTKVKFSKAQIA